MCDATHPDTGAPCGVSEEPHASHIAGYGPSAQVWPNDGYEGAQATSAAQGARKRSGAERTVAKTARAVSRVLARATPPPSAFLRQDPHDTEVEAAKTAALTSRDQRLRVLNMLRALGEDGATDWEMQEVLGLHHNTQTPRRLELVQSGVVVDSGRRRPTGTGRPAIVWIVNEEQETEP